MTSAAEQPPTNEGQRLLRLHTIAESAAESGVSPRSITNYRAGALPNFENSKRLEAIGIPRAAWRQPPTTYHDPPWLADAIDGIHDHPSAVLALMRHCIVESDDAAALAEFDAKQLPQPGEEPFQALLSAAINAERALIPLVYGEA